MGRKRNLVYCSGTVEEKNKQALSLYFGLGAQVWMVERGWCFELVGVCGGSCNKLSFLCCVLCVVCCVLCVVCCVLCVVCCVLCVVCCVLCVVCCVLCVVCCVLCVVCCVLYVLCVYVVCTDSIQSRKKYPSPS